MDGGPFAIERRKIVCYLFSRGGFLVNPGRIGDAVRCFSHCIGELTRHRGKADPRGCPCAQEHSMG